MRIRCAYVVLLVALSTVFGSSAAAQGRKMFATANLRVRSAPSVSTGTILATVPAGRALWVGDCENGWCAVTAESVHGYSSQTYLSSCPVQPYSSSGKGYVNSRGEWVPSPQHTSDGSVPSGASAQCRDGSFSFSRHRRGTCSHHGGVERWLGG